MNPRDALSKLKGSAEEKQSLFNHLIERAQTTVLEDWEVVMLEALKRDFVSEKKVVQMSAVMKGAGSAGI